MPVCNKCKKHSNCLTIDPCDHCGARDWDQTTVLASSGKPKRELSNKTYGQMTHDEILEEHARRYAQDSQVSQRARTVQASNAALNSKISDILGGLSVLVILAAIGFGIYYFFFMPDSEQLSGKYNIPVERVNAPPKPHGCAFNDAPLGDKHCHYDKHVYVYDRTGQVIEMDGNPQTCPTGCGPGYSVQQVFVKVED
jgi:hypothetical protein